MSLCKTYEYEHQSHLLNSLCKIVAFLLNLIWLKKKKNSGMFLKTVDVIKH